MSDHSQSASDRHFALLQQFTNRAVSSQNEALVNSAKRQFNRFLEQNKEFVESNSKQINMLAEQLGIKAPLANTDQTPPPATQPADHDAAGDNTYQKETPESPSGESDQTNQQPDPGVPASSDKEPLYKQSPHSNPDNSMRQSAAFNGQQVFIGQKISGVERIYTLSEITGEQGRETFVLESIDGLRAPVPKALLEYVDTKEELDILAEKYGGATPEPKTPAFSTPEPAPKENPASQQQQPGATTTQDTPKTPTTSEQPQPAPLSQMPDPEPAKTPTEPQPVAQEQAIKQPQVERLQPESPSTFDIPEGDEPDIKEPADDQQQQFPNPEFSQDSTPATPSAPEPAPSPASEPHEPTPAASVETPTSVFEQPQPETKPEQSQQPTHQLADMKKKAILDQSLRKEGEVYPEWEFLLSFDPTVAVDLGQSADGEPLSVHMDAQTFMQPEKFGVSLEEPFGKLRNQLKSLEKKTGLTAQHRESIDGYFDRLIWASLRDH